MGACFRAGAFNSLTSILRSSENWRLAWLGFPARSSSCTWMFEKCDLPSFSYRAPYALADELMLPSHRLVEVVHATRPRLGNAVGPLVVLM